MAPIINVSDETLKTLNPSVYTIVNHSSNDQDFIQIPSINLQVAKQRSHLSKNWFESHEALQKNGERMLTIPEFIEVLKYTKQNNQDIYNEITQIKSPWRAEWLDADFKRKDGKLYINSNHVYQDGNLSPRSSQILQKNTITEDRTPGISLDSWIDSPTKQGLPSKKTESGKLHYGAPMKDNNSVARFGAGDDGACLYCGRDPSGRGSLLGVRAAKQ